MTEKIKIEKKADKLIIVLIIIAASFVALLIILTAFLIKLQFSLTGEKETVSYTQTVYGIDIKETTPLKKDEPKEIINYEEPSSTPPTRLLDVPYINQRAKYPTGCESISAVMALNYAGYDITPEDFIDNYLPQSPAPFVNGSGKCLGYSPSKLFLGSPYSSTGWGCYYPVIQRCLYRIVDNERHDVINLHNTSIQDLLPYIDNDIPVIIWATQGMSKPKRSSTWLLVDDGYEFTWVSPNHCLLLIGYDDTGYYFNDPLTHKNCRYPADIVEMRYNSMGKQALAIASITDTSQNDKTEENEVMDDE